MFKRKFFSVMLSVLMVVTFIPSAVFADGGTENGNSLTIGETKYEAVEKDRLSTSLVNGVTDEIGTGTVGFTVSKPDDTTDWDQTSGEGSTQTYTYVGVYVTIPDDAKSLKMNDEGDTNNLKLVDSAFLQGGKFQHWIPIADKVSDAYSLFYGGREYTLLLQWYSGTNGEGTLVKSEYVKITRNLATPEAKIGTFTYETLYDAVKAAKPGDTIELMKDVVLDQTVTLDKNITIDGKNQFKISGSGMTNTNNIIGFQVNSGTAIFNNLTLTEFDCNLNAPYGSVIKIDENCSNAKVVTNNVNISRFVRDAFTFKSGSFEINNTNIDCTPNKSRDNTLTKGFQIGFSSKESDRANGTINNTNITNAASNYAEWSSAAIEVFNNATVTVNGGSISNSNTGIHVDNYWTGSTSFPNYKGPVSVTVNGTSIDAAESAICLYSRVGQIEQATVTINDGTFKGDIEIVDKQAEDKIIVNGGKFDSQVEEYVAGDKTFAALTSGAVTSYYAGNARSVATRLGADARKGDSIAVKQGDVDLSAVTDGVNVKNEGNGKVVVDNIILNKGESAETYTPYYPPADSLASDRTAAKAELKAYLDLTKYDAAEQAEIKAILEQAEKDIDKAASKDIIAAAVAVAKTQLDAVLTSEEKEAQAEAEKNARLKAGVENTTINLKSTLGKGFIKLNWTKSQGYKVDYYEVYKSTKRYSGYGTKPYFKTKQGGLTGWYKNTKELKKGTRYYFKVRGVRNIAGEIVYTQDSNKAWRLVK